MCISYSILLKYYFFFYFFNNLYFSSLSSLSSFHLSLFSECQSLPLWLWAWICNFGALFIVGRGRRWRPTEGSATRRRTLLSLSSLSFFRQRSRGGFFSSDHGRLSHEAGSSPAITTTESYSMVFWGPWHTRSRLQTDNSTWTLLRPRSFPVTSPSRR